MFIQKERPGDVKNTAVLTASSREMIPCSASFTDHFVAILYPPVRPAVITSAEFADIPKKKFNGLLNISLTTEGSPQDMKNDDMQSSRKRDGIRILRQISMPFFIPDEASSEKIKKIKKQKNDIIAPECFNCDFNSDIFFILIPMQNCNKK